MIGASSFPPSNAQGAVMAMAAVSLVFALKHYVADFLLQTNWIARGKERLRGWVVPLLSHALLHAAITLAVALVVAPRLWWLAGVDLAVHFVVDRAKTLASARGRWHVDEPPFWWLLGFDQLLHQATNIGLAAALVLG